MRHLAYSAKEITALLGYRDETAGGMMTTQFVAMHESDTVGDTIEILRDLDEDFPTVHYVYVLEDDTEKLVGVLSMRTLVVSRNNRPLKEVMYTDIISVLPDEDEDDVAADISKYNLLAMPVCDDGGRLLGLVTVDDALDVIEENTEIDKKTRLWLAVALGAIGFVAVLAVYTVVLLHIAGVA